MVFRRICNGTRVEGIFSTVQKMVEMEHSVRTWTASNFGVIERRSRSSSASGSSNNYSVFSVMLEDGVEDHGNALPSIFDFIWRSQ